MITLSLFLALPLLQSCRGWLTGSYVRTETHLLASREDPISQSRRLGRRQWLVQTTTSFLLLSTPALADDDVFTAGKPLGLVEAKKRFIVARESLDYLVDHYDEISKGGGDNVRRFLGTVGTSSGLYGITKVLKELQEEAKDIVEYTENMTEFDYSLRSADTSVYSANFVEFSAAKTKPEKFFEDALIEAERMQGYMDTMAAELGIKFR